MRKLLGVMLAVAMCGTVFGANYNYNGGGTDPNDWFDAGNWAGGGGVTNWPTAADNALFVNADTRIIISDVVPALSQFQVGRGVASTAVLVEGGVMTNLNQTVAGIVNNGKGSLVVDGGTLVTKQIQVNVFGGGTVLSEDSNMKIKGGSVQVGLGGGDILLGINAPATLEISGGSLIVEDELRFYQGWLNVVGSDATITIDNIFYFGMNAAYTTELTFKPGADGSVSKISADSISFTGSRTLLMDGTFAETDAEQVLVLIELTGADTFSIAELDSLSESLELVNMSSGSLSLSGDSKQLIFTGTPVVRELIKAWEFNTVGDTEGWGNTAANTAIIDVTVTNDVDGIETVLTSGDVTAGDGQLFYNETKAPGSFIARDGKSWRTMEIRLRQIDANSDEPGVASMQFDPQGTTGVLQVPVVTIGKMENLNPICDVQRGSNDWVVVTYDISDLGANDLQSLRFDPIGNIPNTNFNFEVDYVRLYAGLSQPSVVEKLAQAWEFNTPGDAEGWFGVNMTGVTATNQFGGTGGVMTCADVTSTDPQSKYTDTVSVGDGEWTTLEFRARQLTGNWDDVGTTSQVWNIAGTLALIQGVNLGALNDTIEGVTITSQTNGWVLGTVDISSLSGDLNNFRLDFIGQDEPKNFEVDYIRIYKLERQTGYEYWAEQVGLTSANDDPTDDPDSDTFNNLYEFAFGGDPTNSAIAGASPFSAGTTTVNGTNVLNYVYLQNSNPYSGLMYSLEYTDDLVDGAWSNLTGTVESGTGIYTSDLDAVTNQIPTDLPAKFIRTKVSQ